MKKVFFILSFITALSCNDYEDTSITLDNQQKIFTKIVTWENTKKSINYVDYLHFLMNNPDTTHFNEAIIKYFHYRDSLWEKEGVPNLPCLGYVSILINQKGQVLFDDEFIQLDEIRSKSFNFLVNKANNIELSIKKEIMDTKNSPREISTGFFEISFIKGSSLNLHYTIREVALALEDYKQYLILKWYPNNEILQQENYESLNFYYHERLFLYDYTKNELNNPRIYEIVPNKEDSSNELILPRD